MSFLTGGTNGTEFHIGQVLIFPLLNHGAFISYVIDTDVKRFNYENKFPFEGSCLLSNNSLQASTDRIFCKLRN